MAGSRIDPTSGKGLGADCEMQDPISDAGLGRESGYGVCIPVSFSLMFMSFCWICFNYFPGFCRASLSQVFAQESVFLKFTYYKPKFFEKKSHIHGRIL